MEPGSAKRLAPIRKGEIAPSKVKEPEGRLLSSAVDVFVGFVEKIQDIFASVRLLEVAAERFVFEMSGNVLQSAEMFAGTVGRGDKKEEKIDFFAIKAAEIDAFGANGYCADKTLDANVLRMRNGDSVTDAGRAEFFAAHNRADDIVHLMLGDTAGVRQRLNHFANNALFSRRLKFRDNRIDENKIGKFHSLKLLKNWVTKPKVNKRKAPGQRKTD